MKMQQVDRGDYGLIHTTYAALLNNESACSSIKLGDIYIKVVDLIIAKLGKPPTFEFRAYKCNGLVGVRVLRISLRQPK